MMIEQTPLEERWKLVCQSNMKIKGDLLDIDKLCNKVINEDISYTNIKCFAIDIQAMIRKALK